MKTVVPALLCVVQCAAPLLAAESSPHVDLQVGDTAPHFAATTDTGAVFDSTEVLGKRTLVLYFYPADMTGGCTKQACSYRDMLPQFDRLDVLVLGISGDSAENHRHFKQAHQLNFTLLADTDGSIAQAFGVTTRKGFTNKAMVGGREIEFPREVTASRWTFVIDKQGTILYKNSTVDPQTDARQVLQLLEQR